MNTAWFCLAPLLDLAGKPEYADQFDEALRRVAERIQEHCVFVDRIKMLEAELTDTLRVLKFANDTAERLILDAQRKTGNTP
jgi:hypothetical protein